MISILRKCKNISDIALTLLLPCSYRNAVPLFQLLLKHKEFIKRTL